jgi:putative ABC transport system permease protein
MSGDHRAASATERAYRVLLRMYPEAFRHRYGRDMFEMFRDTYRDRGSRGRWVLMSLWSKTLRDVVRTAVGMKLAHLRDCIASPAPPPSSGPEGHRRHRRRSVVESVLLDARFALRTLVRSPSFTAVSITTLALGIGANSAIFSVVNSVLLRPLPYPDPDRLVTVWTQFLRDNRPQFAVSPAEYLDYRSETDAFAEIGAFTTNVVTITGNGNAARVTGAYTTATLLEVLGIEASVGRVFSPDEDRRGNTNVVVLSRALWTERYGADPDITGRTITVNGNALVVVGVMSPDASLPGQSADIWMPLGFDRSRITNRSGHWLTVIGRLAPGATLTSAFAELEAMLVRWEEVYADNHTPEPNFHPMTLVPLDDQLLGNVRPAMLVLLGSVGLVLLLACTNVANLLLARGESRHKEIGIRAALGAGRSRIGRQLLTESLVMSLAGGALGLLIATYGTRLLVTLAPNTIPRISEVGVDSRAIMFTAALSILTGFVFGLLPSVRISRTDLSTALMEGGRSGSHGRETRRTLNGLVMSQIALAVVLLIGSGLLIKSFVMLQRVNPGFAAESRLAFDVSLTANAYPEREDVLAYYARITDGIEALPGVHSAVVVRNLPLRTIARVEGMFIEGRVTRSGEQQESFSVDYQGTSPGYFSTMGIPVIRGRAFDDSDRFGAVPVAVINETAARTYWQGQDPLGARVRALFAGRDWEWITVVGVVGDVRHNGLDTEPRPELYLPLDQTPPATMGWMRDPSVVVRAAGDPTTLASAIREVVRRTDPDVPPANLGTMLEVKDSTVTRERFLMLLLAVFAGTALVIAAVGVYGVVSFSVARRTKEIGIRMALGAEPRHILRSVLKHGASLSGAGAAIGLGIAFASSRLLESLLYGVAVRDLMVFALGSGVLLSISLIASLVPAYRATAVAPTTSLRGE